MAAATFYDLTMRRLIVLALLLSSCVDRSEIDQLGSARRNLHIAPCGAEPAVTGVAGVNDDPHTVFLGDWVVVSVCHLDQLMETAAAQQQPVTLFIEGVDTGNEIAGIDRENGTLTFILDRNDKNKELWRQFLYNPLFDPYATIRISVGVRGEQPLLRAKGANMSLRLKKIYSDASTWIWLALLALVVLALLFLARHSDMLREGPPVEGVRQPYSLARAQMAWWFLLTVAAYVFIWLVTGDRDSISPSLLGLMGISAATAVAAVAISRETMRPSRGWWNDMVSDDRGVVALDRLQIVVWTLVLGGIFLTSVIWDLTMPEFNATLLGLMGISSGTYIGFKLPTKESST
jgi:hypothetical protein